MYLVVVNCVELDQPQCRAVDECVKQILEDYKNEVRGGTNLLCRLRPTRRRNC
jgi:predicted metal-binding protein